MKLLIKSVGHRSNLIRIQSDWHPHDYIQWLTVAYFHWIALRQLELCLLTRAAWFHPGWLDRYRHDAWLFNDGSPDIWRRLNLIWWPHSCTHRVRVASSSLREPPGGSPVDPFPPVPTRSHPLFPSSWGTKMTLKSFSYFFFSENNFLFHISSWKSIKAHLLPLPPTPSPSCHLPVHLKVVRLM